MSSWHISLHPRPEATLANCDVAWAGQSWPTVVVPENLLTYTFEISFEECAKRLGQLPRLDCEPDGALVWFDERGNVQLDGVLYDRAGRLLFAELKFPVWRQTFHELLAALDWPTAPLIVQVLPAAIIVEFDDWIARAT